MPGTASSRPLSLAIVFGGRSCEHEVSVVSTRSMLDAMAQDQYQCCLIGIDLNGVWHYQPDGNLEALLDGAVVSEGGGVRVTPDIGTPGRLLATDSGQIAHTGVDVLFPVLHGTFGEDGTIQGLFEMWGVPYVGCGVAASANGMDKVLAKQLFEIAGIPQNPYEVVTYPEWQADAAAVVGRISNALGGTWFVKPANLGSSVGISKCHDIDELEQGISSALQYDNTVLVEASFEGGQEIECAVLGNSLGAEQPRASAPGEIKAGAEFYDYNAKYVDNSSEIIIPAPLSVQLSDTVKAYAVQAFTALGGAGLARVDFFVRAETGDIAINEVNTLPGFTPISMYPKMWEASGLPYTALIDKLVSLALEVEALKARLERNYSTSQRK